MREFSEVIATPLGTRLRRIERRPDGWVLWTDTKDFQYGTYLRLFDNGSVHNVTIREDEGPCVFIVKGGDGVDHAS